MAFHRDSEIGLIRALERSASKGVRVKLLTPVDERVLARLPKANPAAPNRGVSYRSIPPAETQETVTLLIVDHLGPP